MRKNYLKDAIVDMAFAIADLPNMSDPTRSQQEKRLKKSFLKRLKVLEEEALAGEIIFENIKSGDRDRLIQIMQFVDDPYVTEKIPGSELFVLISQHLGRPRQILTRKLSLANDLKALLAFIDEKERSICSGNRKRCLYYIQKKLSSMYNATIAKRYCLDDFMLDDGWLLQIIRASDLCACNEENIKNIDFLLSAISGGDERKRYFAGNSKRILRCIRGIFFIYKKNIMMIIYKLLMFNGPLQLIINNSSLSFLRADKSDSFRANFI